jgi:hypothetical protein
VINKRFHDHFLLIKYTRHTSGCLGVGNSLAHSCLTHTGPIRIIQFSVDANSHWQERREERRQECDFQNLLKKALPEQRFMWNYLTCWPG